MKFIHYLEKISGVGVLGLTSFILFAVFFLAVLVWVIKADKKMIDDASKLPLD